MGDQEERGMIRGLWIGQYWEMGWKGWDFTEESLRASILCFG